MPIPVCCILECLEVSRGLTIMYDVKIMSLTKNTICYFFLDYHTEYFRLHWSK